MSPITDAAAKFISPRAAQLGFFTGAIFLPIFVQLKFGDAYDIGLLRSLNVLFFPVCWLFFAAGCAWGVTLPARIGHLLRGLLILGFLLIALFYPLELGEARSLTFRSLACLPPVALCYLAIGFELGREKDVSTHHTYGSFLLFAAIGGLVSDQAIEYFGGNAWLLLISGFSLLCAARLKAWETIIFATFMAVLCLYFPVDEKLEQFRDLPENHYVFDEGSKRLTGLHWDRSGQFYLLETTKGWIGVQDLELGFYLAPAPDTVGDRGRAAIMSRMEPGERIALLSTGAASSIQNLRPAVVGGNILAVERNTNSVRSIKSVWWPEEAYIRQIEYMAADERTAIEQSGELFNWIVFENSLGQAEPQTPAFLSPNNLFTPEAMETYFGKLKPEGLLIVEFARPFRGSHPIWADAMVNSLRQVKGAEIRAYMNEKRTTFASRLYLVAGRDTERVEWLGGTLEEAGLKSMPLDEFVLSNCWHGYGDDRPFLKWMCKGGRRPYATAGIAAGIFIVLLCALSVVILLGRRSIGGSAVGHFFLLSSTAQTLLFIAVVYKLRGYFRDETLTFYILLLYMTLLAALASFLAPRLAGSMLFKRSPWLTCLVLVLTAGLLEFLPFTLFFPLLAPLGLCMGWQFHLGLMTQRKCDDCFRWALACHSAGVLLAYLLLFAVMLNFGIDATLTLSLALFAVAALMMEVSARRPTIRSLHQSL